MRSRENIHVIYVLLFLEAAFFIFQRQDPARYVEMFAFVPSAVLDGEIWRIFTYQFAPSDFFGSKLIGFLFTMLILYVMGNALEEEWGTFDFVVFWTLSVLASAAAGFALGAILLSSTFLLALLFAYAVTYPQMRFLLFLVLPVKVTWIAWFFLGLLGLGLVMRNPFGIATAAGALASMSYFWWRHGRYLGGRVTPRLRRKVQSYSQPSAEAVASDEKRAEANLVQFAEVERTLGSGDAAEIDAMIARLDREKTPGVNICPPVDFKPLAEDRFCARCEGFQECSARHMRATRKS